MLFKVCVCVFAVIDVSSVMIALRFIVNLLYFTLVCILVYVIYLHIYCFYCWLRHTEADCFTFIRVYEFPYFILSLLFPPSKFHSNSNSSRSGVAKERFPNVHRLHGLQPHVWYQWIPRELWSRPSGSLRDSLPHLL